MGGREVVVFLTPPWQSVLVSFSVCTRKKDMKLWLLMQQGWLLFTWHLLVLLILGATFFFNFQWTQCISKIQITYSVNQNVTWQQHLFTIPG